MAKASKTDTLLGPAPSGLNTPGLLLAVTWVGCGAIAAYFILFATPDPATVTGSGNALADQISTFADTLRLRFVGYGFAGIAIIGSIAQLAAESVLWHLNRR